MNSKKKKRKKGQRCIPQNQTVTFAKKKTTKLHNIRYHKTPYNYTSKKNKKTKKGNFFSKKGET